MPSFASQSRMVPSRPPLASRLPLPETDEGPSGAKARRMAPGCPPVQSRAPLSTSQSLTLPSRLAVASVRSSELKVRPHVWSVCARQARCKVWPASRHTRTSSRLLTAAQYCPLPLMATVQMTSMVSVKTHSCSSAPDESGILHLDALQVDAAQEQAREIEATQMPA